MVQVNRLASPEFLLRMASCVLTIGAALSLTSFELAADSSSAAPATATAAPATAEDPALTLTDSAGVTKQFSRSALLAHPRVETLKLKKGEDPGHPGMAMAFRAVPLAELFREQTVARTDVLRFVCTDGFSAPLTPATTDAALSKDAADATNGRAVAYIAVEAANEPWPDLAKLHKNKHQGTAGPFYLVWRDGKKNGISSMEWPFKLAALKMEKSIEKTYPNIAPQAEVRKAHPSVERGLNAFVKNCFACHLFNKAGDSAIGPDLNFPTSAITYLGRARLGKYIRDPQSLRFWPNAQMRGIGKDSLPDAELNDLLDYLEAMARDKRLPAL